MFRWINLYYGVMFFTLSITLAVTMTFLLCTLRKTFSGVGSEPVRNVFAKEMKSLTCILAFFCASYFIRTVGDITLAGDVQFEACGQDRDLLVTGCSFLVVELLQTVVYDMLPIGAILLYHERNFKRTRKGSETTREAARRVSSLGSHGVASSSSSDGKCHQVFLLRQDTPSRSDTD